MLTKIRSPFQRHSSFDRDIQDLWTLMFHSMPSDPKPPMVVDLYGCLPEDEFDNQDIDEVEVSEGGVLIQLAVAGYTSEDIKVYTQNNVLFIEGNNLERDEVPTKFKSKFKKTLPTKNNVDLVETQVDLVNGILTIKIPFTKPEDNRNYLFGKS